MEGSLGLGLGFGLTLGGALPFERSSFIRAILSSVVSLPSSICVDVMGGWGGVGMNTWMSGLSG